MARLATKEPTGSASEAEDATELTAEQPVKTKDRLPPVPGLNLSGESFFDYLASLTESNWEHFTVYVYRVWPVLDSNKTPQYIDKLNRGFGLEYMLAEHGSGDYSFTGNDTNIKGKSRTICQVPKSRPLRLRDDEHPPKIPVVDVALDDPANGEYVKKLIREGKLTPQGDIPSPPQSGEGELARTVRDALNLLLRDKLENKRGEPGEAAAYQRMMDMMGKANDQSIAMVLAQVKQQDPAHFIQMLAALKELMPAGTSGDRLVEQLLRENAETRKENRELLMRLLDRPAAPPPPTLAEQVEQFKALKDAFGDGGGGRGGGGTAAALAEVLPALAPHIPATLGVVGNMIGGLFSAFFNRGGGGPLPRQPMQPNPAGTGPHPVDLGPAGIESPQPGVDPMQTQSQPADPMVKQLAAFLPMIQAPLLKYINEGRSGADFAGWLADSYGEVNYAMLQRLTKEQILQALALADTFAPLVQNMPEQLGQFVEEFLNPDSVPEEESETAPAAAPEAKPRRGKKNEPAAS